MKELNGIYVMLLGNEVEYIYKVENIVYPVSGVDVLAYDVVTGKFSRYEWCLTDLKKDRTATVEEVNQFEKALLNWEMVC